MGIVEMIRKNLVGILQESFKGFCIDYGQRFFQMVFEKTIPKDPGLLKHIFYSFWVYGFCVCEYALNVLVIVMLAFIIWTVLKCLKRFFALVTVWIILKVLEYATAIYLSQDGLVCITLVSVIILKVVKYGKSVTLYEYSLNDLVNAMLMVIIWKVLEYLTLVHTYTTKQSCVRLFPQISNISHIHIVRDGKSFLVDSGVDSSFHVWQHVVSCLGNSIDWNSFERRHDIYASLLRALTKSEAPSRNCIQRAVSASSTDKYPVDDVANTLDPSDTCTHGPSCWSSIGTSDPEAPETLIYRVKDGSWVITEIDVRLYLDEGIPKYYPRYMRFQIGYLKGTLPLNEPADHMFVWSYRSPLYAMTKPTENRLQQFVLPEPVLCIDGYVQVELLGRVHRDQRDRLFYFCISNVEVHGRPLDPSFVIKPESNGKLSLKYNPPSKLGLLRRTTRMLKSSN